MAITQITNIPVLGALPNIPKLYSGNPSLSFIIDMVLLSVAFGSLLAPLGYRIVKEKKLGYRFGAVLGLIFGITAAFALHNAGRTLFTFWLTSVAVVAVIGVVLYKIMRAIGLNKLWANIVFIAVTFTLILFWFAQSGLWSENVALGASVLLLFPILLIMLLMVVFQIEGGKIKGLVKKIFKGEPTPPPGPTPPEAPPSKRGLPGKILGPVGGLFKKIFGPPPVQGAGRQVQETLRRGENIAAQGQAEAGDIARGGQQALENLEIVQDESGRAIASAEQGNIEQLCSQIETLVSSIQAMLKTMQRQQRQMAGVLSLRRAIEDVISQYNRYVSNLQVVSAQTIEQLEQRINALPEPEREQLAYSLERLRGEVAAVETLREIEKRLNEQLRALDDARLTHRYNEVVEITTQLREYTKDLARKQCRQMRPEAAKEMLDEIKGMLGNIIADLECTRRNYEQFLDLVRTLQIRVGTIRGEIRHWADTFDTLYERLSQGFAQVMQDLRSRIEELEARQQPPPGAPPAAQPPRPAPSQTLQYFEILRNVHAKKAGLQASSKQLRNLIKKLNFVRGDEKTFENANAVTNMAQAAYDAARQSAIREGKYNPAVETQGVLCFEKMRESMEQARVLSSQAPPEQAARLRGLLQQLDALMRSSGPAMQYLSNFKELCKSVASEVYEANPTITKEKLNREVKKRLNNIADSFDELVNLTAGFQRRHI